MTRARPRLWDLRQLAVSQPGAPQPALDRDEIYRLWRSLTPTAEARDRGLRLLKENLSPAQRAQYERRGYFVVAGGETGRRYRIRFGDQMNVEQLNKRGRPARLLCFMPEGDLVEGDVMLAQKLALELFESSALKVAREYPIEFAPFRRTR
jgi:hypothetical protein